MNPHFFLRRKKILSKLKTDLYVFFTQQCYFSENGRKNEDSDVIFSSLVFFSRALLFLLSFSLAAALFLVRSLCFRKNTSRALQDKVPELKRYVSWKSGKPHSTKRIWTTKPVRKISPLRLTMETPLFQLRDFALYAYFWCRPIF